MSNYKAEITLGIIALVMFGIVLYFATNIFDPIMTTIGDGFTTMVENVFSGDGMDWGGAGK